MISTIVVALFDLAIVWVIARRARDVLFAWPLDRAAVQAATRVGVAGIDALAREGRPSAAAELARAMIEAEPGEVAIAIEDGLEALRDRLTRPLLWLRVMAPAASALGLVGAAVQAGWARHPPGLLALDPDRVLGMAMTDGASCFALGIAGSTSALGALFFLRSRALAILGDLQRLADRGRAVESHAWTVARG